MAEATEGRTSPLPKPKSEFSIYQNPAFSAVLTAKSLQPRKSATAVIVALGFVSGAALLSVIFREDESFEKLRLLNLSDSAIRIVARTIQVLVGLIFTASLSALVRISLSRIYKSAYEISKEQNINTPNQLSQRQLALLGVKQKSNESVKKISKLEAVPLRTLTSSYSPTRPSRIGSGQWGVPSGKASLPQPLSSPLTPPLRKPSSISGKGISSEEKLEQFLADVDKMLTESATQAAKTPPSAPIGSFGLVSPSSKSTPTPVRAVRMSPSSHQKYGTPPKKGEGEIPSPMSVEKTIEALEILGVFPYIEQWRDNLRQWFSTVLLNPLLDKIESSHVQVMQAAANIGISIVVNPVGSDSMTGSAPFDCSQLYGERGWPPTFTQDEDGFLHQLRALLTQARDASRSNLQIQPQNIQISGVQGCLDAITEHQRLHALMKGELVKGLLPQSSVPADYTIKRIRELAEGTCVKNYEFATGEAFDKTSRKWTPEIPTDSHLLTYLFCAFLDHPLWMLHMDPTSYSGSQSSKNPLFLGVLPPKDRFPEKYLAIVSTVPEVIHTGASVLVVGKQNPPVFALYWDKKLQFSLQGRTALWDAVLLFCHRIHVSYGGVVRGVHLGSAAFSILPILQTDCED